MKRLVKGDRREEVFILQDYLFQLRYLKTTDLTGELDDTTHKAVMKFQANNDLIATGVVDSGTWDALKAAVKGLPK